MKYKILIGIVVAYSLIIGIIFFIKELNKVEIIIYPDITIEYSNGKWSQKELNQNKKYNIYFNNQFSYKSEIKNDDGEIKINGETVYDFVASNKEIRFIDYRTSDMTDDEIEEILTLAKIKSKNTTISDKVELDYDRDGKIETLYFVSNSYPDSDDPLFSLIYVKDDVSEFIFKERYYSQKGERECSLASVMSINDDMSYQLLVRCPGFDNSGVQIDIYEVVDKKLVKTVEI